MKAREIMTAAVKTAQPDTTVADLARQMTEARISGVPIVDARASWSVW